MVRTFWNGLEIEGEMVPFTPATREDPSDGGFCEDVRIVGIDDAEELSDWLSDSVLSDLAPMLSAFARITGTLPESALNRILGCYEDDMNADLWNHGE